VTSFCDTHLPFSPAHRMYVQSPHLPLDKDQAMASVASQETKNQSVASSSQPLLTLHHLHHLRLHTLDSTPSSSSHSSRQPCRPDPKTHYCAYRSLRASTPAGCIRRQKGSPRSPSPSPRIETQSGEKGRVHVELGGSGAMVRARCFRVRSLVVRRLKRDGRRRDLRARGSLSW